MLIPAAAVQVGDSVQQGPDDVLAARTIRPGA
jgi:hypothetical protein